MDVTEFLAEFRSTLSAPESYLNPSPELSSKCLIGLKTVFDFYKKCSENGSVKIPTGPLSELFTEGFDNEQIWEEIQLVNEPVIDYMGKLLSEMENWDYSELFNDSVNAPQQSHSDGGNGSESEDLQHVDGSDEGAEMYSSDEEDIDGDEEGRGKVSKHTGRKTVVDDRFFKLSEMEQFLEKIEREKEQGSGKESEEGSDDIDYFLEHPMADDSQASYADFFDPPEDDALVQEQPDQEHEFEEDIQMPVASDDSTEEKEEYETDGSDYDVDDEVSGDSDQAPDELVKKDEKHVLSTREKKQLKLQRQVEQLEAANVAERSWQMSGETSAKARPLNSLLEEDLSFDHMSRPPPVITEETTKTLEDIIKQRIIDEAWDDVERKIKPAEKPYDYSRSRPLEQEKSKLSLAEVYEQEYIKQTQGTEEVKEDKRHTEIRELMKKLFVKLDALSNFHFTPKPPKAEVKIVPSVPAIQMEEVAPLATSDAMLVAPEEVQAKSRKPEVGTTEKTVTDRKRERRLKKKQKRLRLAEKRQREKIISKFRPGLGNKYTRKELTKKLKQREQDEFVDKSLRSSSKFFARLQDKVIDEVRAVKREGRTQNKGRTSSGKHFKL